MGKLYLLNAFSLNMLDFDRKKTIDVRVVKIDEKEARKWLENNQFISAVGHESTAKIISQKLGMEVKPNRIMVKMKEGDIAIVFQLLQRLPEGKVLSEQELQQIPAAWFMVIVR